MHTFERIDLHLPKSWNSMTIEELETIARILQEASTDNASGIGTSMLSVKCRIFIAINKLVVMQAPNPVKPVEDQYIIVRRSYEDRYFILYLWQIKYWMDEDMKWFDSSPTLTRFPYPELRMRKFLIPHTYKGPKALMQNFCWRQYRFACDYISYYMTEQNRLVEMIEQGNVSDRDMKRQQRAVSRAKAMFMATLFNRRVRYIDTETKCLVKGYTYVSWQSVKNMHDFINFPDYKFQVILFWWIGMMNYLQTKYPKVFRKVEVSKQSRTNPLEIYSRTTATIEKHIGINEEELNRELYTNVLQHLQDMMDESDRMKELERKK